MGETKKMWHELPYEKWLEISGYGIDIEAEEIVANLRNYESKFRKDLPFEGLTEQQRRELA